MDFIKKNARPLAIVAAIVIVAGFAIASQNNNDQNQDQATEQAQTTEEQKGSPEQAAETPADGISKSENTYSTVVERGDNQTALVRKIVVRYLAENNKTLNAEQKLHAETNLVNTLPRDDLIFAGETIQLSNDTLSQVISASERLTPAQMSLWARYL